MSNECVEESTRLRLDLNYHSILVISILICRGSGSVIQPDPSPSLAPKSLSFLRVHNYYILRKILVTPDAFRSFPLPKFKALTFLHGFNPCSLPDDREAPK